MRFLISFLILMAAAAQSAFAACEGVDLRELSFPENQNRLAQRVADIPYAEGIAFRATRGGQVITVFGTAHLHALDIPPQLLKELPATDLVLTEISPEEEARMQVSLQNSGRILLGPTDPGLDAFLSRSEMKALSDGLQAIGVPAEIAPRFQPWFATLLLAIPPCEVLAQAQRPNLDQRIAMLAKANGIALNGLESFEEILSALTTVGLDDQIILLQAMLAGQPFAADIIVTTQALWREQKPQQILALSTLERFTGYDTEYSDITETLMRALLDERNIRWLPRILTALEAHDTVLIAVGAGHLGGEKGLLVLLEQEGFVITRFNPFAD